jgi:hypothetical protein
VLSFGKSQAKDFARQMFQTSATQSTKGRPRMPPRKDFRDCGNCRDDNACQEPRSSRWARIQARLPYPVSITRPPIAGPLIATEVLGRFELSHAVILRMRSPSLREGFPTKDPCIPDDSSAKTLPDLVMRFHAGFEPTVHVRVARNAQVLRLLSSRFAGRKTALRMTALWCRACGAGHDEWEFVPD